MYSEPDSMGHTPSYEPPSQEAVKPIPAFYCAYLLRSTVRHASLYIGSTPNPARRLAQHNGLIKGGAKRTHKDSLRPWEMVMLVSGFMSRTAALQFEWAWQHTPSSRHADHEDESSQPPVQIYPRSERRAKRSSRPRSSLKSILKSLHLLLRSPYFSVWPLEVHFFSAEIYRAWQGCCQLLDNLIPDSINVVVDQYIEKQQDGTKPFDSLDIKDAKLKNYFAKAEFLLDKHVIPCGICKQKLNLEDDLIAICPHGQCNCASHILCLSSKFLEIGNAPNRIIPMNGKCPSCSSIIEWSILMKEMTLRIRGKRTETKSRSGRLKRNGGVPFIDSAYSSSTGSRDKFSDFDATDKFDQSENSWGPKLRVIEEDLGLLSLESPEKRCS
ncbi:GIY-YIG catalytic domain-containing protein [Coccidioides immitis RS]|uniref:GIY-YIG catalytic domain-containing protein n=2 Tax=Coccidioides immitis TaxID=5501 RepID=A0A0D8JUI8_COCIM|nr:GIY-YIG catalytic domain-containing protein [Coccidioides immitis RS]KJF60596.1 GIY-YIG catalytic domain-containing protein [Coccidioides immitis RS]KMP03679.1 hypothetical protein CIRG_03371 [Coccidioides immitis RMSCC 2394]